MIVTTAKKKFTLNISGTPAKSVADIPNPTHIAVTPFKIPFIKPRLKVKVGDPVKLGGLLFEDKRNPEVRFLSPGGGTVADIVYGPRRIIQKVAIRLDTTEAYETFPSLTEEEIQNTARGEIVERMLKGGVWPFLRMLPFRDIAPFEQEPVAIFVALHNTEPFHPDPHVYLAGRRDLLPFGIKVLQRLAPRVILTSKAAKLELEDMPEGIEHQQHEEIYPAGDPAVQLYCTRKSPSENRNFYVDGQDLLHIAFLLKRGHYPVAKTIVLAGGSVANPMHFRTRTGIQLSQLAKGRYRQEDEPRFISGGIFGGHADGPDGYLGFYENALTLIPSRDIDEAFGFMRPGINKPTLSKTFLSVFNANDLDLDCRLNGEPRACINCGYCAQVCPVGILVQFAMKNYLADEIEELLQLGLLDCAECGLCSYVCPSKIDLCVLFRQAKAEYYKEMTQP
jgi:Na+-transporting NADH:ubiquinone oxidoreductase subunit A